MGWRRDEVWLDTDLLWFREEPRRRFGALAVSVPAFAAEPPPFLPVSTGLEASRRRRLEKKSARRRRHATRTVPAIALVLGSATMLSYDALRPAAGAKGAGTLWEDPPSLTFGLDLSRFEAAAAAATRRASSSPHVKPAGGPEPVRVVWHHATSSGLPYAGRLSDGTQLPVQGPDWVTWNPVTDSVPNLPHRLYGNERTIRSILSVIAGYRSAHPEAPRVVVGDISLAGGGRMDEHVSHQNGLDVDVYYPRRDGLLRAPVATSQIERALAQDLLDRFVAAGAQVVFVGFSTGLHGASGVVVPYPNHENHMHVRFPAPG